MKNAMQLKAIIKNMAKQKNISAQLVLQNYMLERLLERISVSKYRDNFILKGGFLIAAMVGLDNSFFYLIIYLKRAMADSYPSPPVFNDTTMLLGYYFIFSHVFSFYMLLR